MPRNGGTGTYSQPGGTDAVSGATASSAAFNTLTDDLGNEITASLPRAGQAAMTGNLQMGNNKITGLANGTAITDAVALGQLQGSVSSWADGGGTADVITATYTPTVTTTPDGITLGVRATAANATTTPTFAPDGVTARTIVKDNGLALAAGDIAGDGHDLILRYDSTGLQWNLLNPASAASIASVVEDTSPQLGGFLDPNGQYVGWAKGADTASASPLVVGTDGNYFDVTGTTGFSAMTVAANRLFTLQFDGILTITHGASINLPSGANITTAVGDEATFFSTAANVVRCINYERADGTALVAPATGITVLDRDVAEATWSNTAAAQTVMSYTLPANTLPSTGILRITWMGRFDNQTGGGRALVVRVRFGGVTLYQDLTNTLGSLGETALRFQLELMANNSTSSQKLGGQFMMHESNISPNIGDGRLDNPGNEITPPIRGIASSTDTTANADFEITLQMDTASASLIITKDMHLVELI